MPASPKPRRGAARRAQRARTKARRDHNYGRTPDGRDFAAFVRARGHEFGCAVAQLITASIDHFPGEYPCAGRIEAAHIHGRNAHPALSGVRNLLPMCTRHHRQGVPHWDIDGMLTDYAQRLGKAWEGEAKHGPEGEA